MDIGTATIITIVTAIAAGLIYTLLTSSNKHSVVAQDVWEQQLMVVMLVTGLIVGLITNFLN